MGMFTPYDPTAVAKIQDPRVGTTTLDAEYIKAARKAVEARQWDQVIKFLDKVQDRELRRAELDAEYLNATRKAVDIATSIRTGSSASRYWESVITLLDKVHDHELRRAELVRLADKAGDVGQWDWAAWFLDMASQL